jgi:hypothetical protein
LKDLTFFIGRLGVGLKDAWESLGCVNFCSQPVTSYDK